MRGKRSFDGREGLRPALPLDECPREGDLPAAGLALGQLLDDVANELRVGVICRNRGADAPCLHGGEAGSRGGERARGESILSRFGRSFPACPRARRRPVGKARGRESHAQAESPEE